MGRKRTNCSPSFHTHGFFIFFSLFAFAHLYVVRTIHFALTLIFMNSPAVNAHHLFLLWMRINRKKKNEKPCKNSQSTILQFRMDKKVKTKRVTDLIQSFRLLVLDLVFCQFDSTPSSSFTRFKSYAHDSKDLGNVYKHVNF